MFFWLKSCVKPMQKFFLLNFFFFLIFQKKFKNRSFLRFVFSKFDFLCLMYAKQNVFFRCLNNLKCSKMNFYQICLKFEDLRSKQGVHYHSLVVFSISVCQGNVLWWCECNVFSEHSLILQFEIFDINLLNLNICCILLLSGWHITVDIKRKVQEMNSLKHSLCKAHGIIISFP